MSGRNPETNMDNGNILKVLVSFLNKCGSCSRVG